MLESAICVATTASGPLVGSKIAIGIGVVLVADDDAALLVDALLAAALLEEDDDEDELPHPATPTPAAATPQLNSTVILFMMVSLSSVCRVSSERGLQLGVAATGGSQRTIELRTVVASIVETSNRSYQMQMSLENDSIYAGEETPSDPASVSGR